MAATFTRKHHLAIAKLLGNMAEPDDFVQTMTQKFGQFFQDDNELFNYRWFHNAVAREREGRPTVKPNPVKF